MCSDEGADAHRFMDVLDAAIAAKQAPAYPKYKAWAKRVAAKPRPKAGEPGGKAGKRAREQQGAEAALVAQIRGRQAQALQPLGGVLGSLMARYGGGGEENVPAEPSEEEFAAAAARLKQRGGGSKQAGGSKKGGAPKAAGKGGGKRAKQ